MCVVLKNKECISRKLCLFKIFLKQTTQKGTLLVSYNGCKIIPESNKSADVLSVIKFKG